jgi:hypothetical protein
MRKIVIMMMMVMVILGAGCSRLSVERTFDKEGIKTESVLTYGFFINRANQLKLDKSSDAMSGEKDILESMIDEDSSPGNEALKNFIDIYKLGSLAAGVK